MEIEKVEDLFSTEYHDVVQATLKEFKEKHVETDHKILELMDSKPPLFERCQLIGRYLNVGTINSLETVYCKDVKAPSERE